MNVRTQFGGLLAALMIVVILLFLTGPIADLPKAVLGATIIAAALGLVERDAWRALWAGDRVEFTIAAVTTAGVVVQGVLQAMAFAVGLSIVDVVRRSARPHDAVLGWVPSLDRYGDVAVHPDAQVVPGIVVYRLDDRLFFANADYVRGRVREALRGAAAPARWLVVDMEATSDVDVTGLEVLTDLAQSLQADGVTLCVARLRSGLADHLDRAGLADAIPAPLRYPTVHAAVAACQEADGDSAAEPAR